MSGLPVGRRSRYENPGTAWSADEVAILSDAVLHAPSVQNTRPWSLTLQERTAVLSELAEVPLPEQDLEGRDRRISCGAALENLVLAVRSLGWAADVDVRVAGGAVTATVIGARRAVVTQVENRRFRAISDRRSHRPAFGSRAVSEDIRDSVRSAATSPGVVGRWISGHIEALAMGWMLDYAARVLQADYQRALSMWCQAAPRGAAEQQVDFGLDKDAFTATGLGAIGLVTSHPHVPDACQLAAQIECESVLVISTRADEPYDHVRAGEAVEDAWLEATSRGLVASIMTQPLHLAEVRTRLEDLLDGMAVPQALMRFGYPDPHRRH